jgi:GT2 family glycosyltransferase
MKEKILQKSLPNLVPVDFVSGCAMLVHNDVFRKVGLLDPSLIMYGEEIDLCWRASQAGYLIACATKARVWHKVSSSADKAKPNSRYLKHRNQILFYRKYSKGLQYPLMFFFSLLKFIQISILDIYHHKSSLIPVTAKAWLDGWR